MPSCDDRETLSGRERASERASERSVLPRVLRDYSDQHGYYENEVPKLFDETDRSIEKRRSIEPLAACARCQIEYLRPDSNSINLTGTDRFFSFFFFVGTGLRNARLSNDGPGSRIFGSIRDFRVFRCSKLTENYFAGVRSERSGS